jgi:hypothetical protein
MIPFAQIAGGMNAAGLVDHLMNNTLSQDQSRLAAYYGRGPAEVSGFLIAARDIADGTVTFDQAISGLMWDYIRDGGSLDLLDVIEERYSKRVADLVDRIMDGLDYAPLAVMRPDIHPLVLEGLGIEPDGILNNNEIGALLSGLRADGQPIVGKRYAKEREMPSDPKTGERKWATPIGSYDFAPAPDKSVSVAWAFANEREQAQIMHAHLESARDAVGHITAKMAVIVSRQGAGQRARAQGHVGWLEFTHHTARRVKVSTDEAGTKIEDQGLAGDPDLHTHFLIMNAVFGDTGKVGSLDTLAIRGLLFEADALYHALLAQRLRRSGFDVELDHRTGAARMAVVPEHISRLFSKRTNMGEALARQYAASVGEDWDLLTGEQRADRIKQATQGWEQKSKGDKDDQADFQSWRQQAKDAGWEPGESLHLVGPSLAPLKREDRLRVAYEVALPILAKALEERAVVTHHTVRVAALQGLIHAGIQTALRDVDDVVAIMKTEGVTQYGERTALAWGQEDDKRYVSVTTKLHEDQEREFIDLARAAAADRSGAIPAKLLADKISKSGLTFSDAHGKAQRNAIERLGTGGRLGVVVAAAGAGKTSSLKPLVAAWHAMGRDVWGASTAWRQTDDLVDAGIPEPRRKAFSVLLDGLADGSVRMGPQSVLAVDELGLLGTRQGLELLRHRARLGFSIVALGDDKQCQSIQAGPVIDLVRRALGAEQVPEILTTRRQKTEREREIVGLLRDGRAAEALTMKRADGTAELAYGGRDGVIRRVAEIYRETIEATGSAPSIAAPTNQDAHNISEAVRKERRRLGFVGEDLVTVKATDGERQYPLALAKGDKVRLFRNVGADYGGGKGGSIGRNGSVLTILAADATRLQVLSKTGKVGWVAWERLAEPGTGRVQLAYGDCMTIHTAQGSTTSAQILAFPGGSQQISGATGYSGATRYEHVLRLVTNEMAERIAVKQSRPLNDLHDVTTDDLWAVVAKNMSNQTKKDSALALREKVGQFKRGAVRDFQSSHPGTSGSLSHIADLALRRRIDLGLSKGHQAQRGWQSGLRL